MANQRSKSKNEVGGYFENELVNAVRRVAAARRITVTDFIVSAYRRGVEEDRRAAISAAHRRTQKRPCQV